MPSDRRPNFRLRALITEASYSGQGLVRAVNALGTEAGLSLGYDRNAAAHWLAGIRPPPQVAALIAEALSRKLGRPVTVDDAGLGRPETGPGPVPDLGGDGVATLVELCSADRDPARRALLHGLVYNLKASSVPTWSEAVGIRPSARETSLPTTRIGMPQVAAVQAMTEMFYDADIAFGSGGIRSALTAYLSGEVAAWLRAPAPAEVHRSLASAASKLVYFAGFLCFDSELHGLAQRYYLTAIDLAREAQDPVAYATALRGMSVQAHALGHRQAALHLAQAGAAVCGAVSGTSAAFLAGQLALATAATDDRRGALILLDTAERYLQADDGAGGSLGSYHRAALSHQLAEVLAASGDRVGAIDALTTSISRRPVVERRSRAITIARMSDLQLRVGHLEAACVNGHSFLDDYVYLHSARADTALTRLRGRLVPYRRNIAARVLLTRIRTLTSKASDGPLHLVAGTSSEA